MRKLDLIGHIFGRLTVIREGEPRGAQRRWYCQCTCGNIKLISQCSLRSGTTNSCGCIHKEMLGERFRTHGQTGSPEYVAWVNMRLRCNNPRNISYFRYGGRGIKVCERWQNDFQAFLADVGYRPSPAHSLDRIDNNRDYSPENCRWITRTEQGRNKRNNHLITFQGQTLSLAEWAEKLHMPHQVLRRRINKSKQPIEQALTTPYKPRK